MASKVQKIEDQLQQQLDLHIERFNSKDFEAIIEGFTEDSIFMPPEHGAVIGKDDLKTFCNKAFSTDMTLTDVKILGWIADDKGEVAVNWGSSAIIQEGTKTPTKWMHVNRRVGKDWKIVWNMFNSDVPRE